MSWTLIKLWLGKLANLAGYPAMVRECDYEGVALNATVRVRRLELYTLVSVNGLDVYFNRLTGSIDGVGASPTSGCSSRFPERLVNAVKTDPRQATNVDPVDPRDHTLVIGNRDGECQANECGGK
jgi:hypothetical protein